MAPFLRFQGEVLLAQLRLLRHHHGALYRVLQFANVARPGVLLQGIHGGGRDARDLLVHLARELAHEVVDQQRNVFPAFAQRRQSRCGRRSAGRKVGPELAFLDQLLQVFVGGGDKAEVHLMV